MADDQNQNQDPNEPVAKEVAPARRRVRKPIKTTAIKKADASAGSDLPEKQKTTQKRVVKKKVVRKKIAQEAQPNEAQPNEAQPNEPVDEVKIDNPPELETPPVLEAAPVEVQLEPENPAVVETEPVQVPMTTLEEEPLLTAEDLNLEPTSVQAEEPTAIVSTPPPPTASSSSSEAVQPDVPQLYREVPSYDSSPMTYSFVSPFAPAPTAEEPKLQTVEENQAAAETDNVVAVDGEVVEQEDIPVIPAVEEQAAVVSKDTKAHFDWVGAFKAGFLKIFGQLREFVKPVHIFTIIGCFGVAVIVYLVFAFGVIGAGYAFVKNLFVPKPVVPIVVNVDDKILRSSGIQTAYVFAKNRGSKSDGVIPAFQNAFYFGALGEMIFQGQTGIDTAIFYGDLRDLIQQTNLFIQYVKDLREMKDLYAVDVYQMLNQTTQRDEKLQDYFNRLEFYSKRGSDNISQIGVISDDLKVAYNSLAPDRTSTEKDFFVALDSFAGEKSDFLLKSFIDIAQKQASLKARLDAMQSILKYTVTLKQYLDIRIKAVDQNRAALLQGIQVVDIPGANLNIIIPATK